jgi:hypothetical protein
MRKQCTLAKHPLKASRELNLRNSETMTQVKGAVHVWVGEIAEPLRELGPDFARGQAFELLLGRWIYLENALIRPSFLVLFLEFDQKVALDSLEVWSGTKQSR